MPGVLQQQMVLVDALQALEVVLRAMETEKKVMEVGKKSKQQQKLKNNMSADYF